MIHLIYLLWFGEAIRLVLNTINSIAFSYIIYGVFIIAMPIMIIGNCRQNKEEDKEYDEIRKIKNSAK